MKKTNTKGATKPSYSWLTNELEMAGLTGRVLDYLKNPKGLLKDIGLYEFLWIWNESGRVFESSKAFNANKDLMLKEMYLLCEQNVSFTEKGDQTIVSFVMKFGSAKYAIAYAKEHNSQLLDLLERADFNSAERVEIVDCIISNFSRHSYDKYEYENLVRLSEKRLGTKAQNDVIDFIIDEYVAKNPSGCRSFISENMSERRKTNLLSVLSTESADFGHFDPVHKIALEALFVTKDERFASFLAKLITKSKVEEDRETSLYYQVYKSVSGIAEKKLSQSIGGNEVLQRLLYPVTKEIVMAMNGTEDSGGWIKQYIYRFFDALPADFTSDIMEKIYETIKTSEYSRVEYCLMYYKYDSSIRWITMTIEDISAGKYYKVDEVLTLQKLVAKNLENESRIIDAIRDMIIPKLLRIDHNWVDLFEFDAIFPSSGIAEKLRLHAATLLVKNPSASIIAKYL